MKDLKKYVAEFIGTAVLVGVACGVAGQVCDVGGAGHLMTALAFGLVIVAMAYSIGNISGCGYVIAQFLGATAGAGLLYALVRDNTKLGANGLYGANIWTEQAGSVWLTFAIEAVLTFIFVLAILGVTSKESNSSVAGLVIGGALVLVHLIGIPFTGTSVNPARTFGPALFAGTLSTYWVFLLAPMVGGALAAVVYRFLSKE